MRVRITKQGLDYIVDCGYDYKLLSLLKKALKVKLPASQSTRFSRQDGFLRLYKEYNSLSAQIKVKRGHIDRLFHFLERSDISYELDEGENTPKIVPTSFSRWLQDDDRDYQREAVRAWLSKGYGIIKVPTRGGKTVIASEIIKQLTEEDNGIKILFLTDLTDLYNQTVQEIEKFTLEEVGEIKGTLFEPKRITVAMTQTLQSKLKREAPLNKRHRITHNFLEQINVVFVDECHDFTSKSRLEILKKAKTPMICGLSGTPEKTSNLVDNYAMKGIIGDVVYEIKEKDLEDRGILAKSRVLLCLNSIFSGQLEEEYNDFVERHVFNNEERNFKIAALAQICRDLGLKVLIMTRSKKHGQILKDKFGFDYISGDDDVAERKRIKNKVITEEGGGVTIVTEIWKKGLTLPQAQVLINITVGREESNVIQKRGRILGATDQKNKALTIDFIDFSDFFLSDHSYDRMNSYEKFTGKENIDVIDSNVGLEQFLQDFYDYVNHWFYEEC